MKLRNAALAHLLLIALVVSITSTTASAQAAGTIYIPFAFTANHQHVPSGFYKVDLLSDRYLALIDSKTGVTKTVLMVSPVQGTKISTRTGFVFYFSGQRYYLKEVKVAGSSMHSELAVQPRPEPTLAKGAAPEGSTIEIAAKK
jgi:hypothetical protein